MSYKYRRYRRWVLGEGTFRSFVGRRRRVQPFGQGPELVVQDQQGRQRVVPHPCGLGRTKPHHMLSVLLSSPNRWRDLQPIVEEVWNDPCVSDQVINTTVYRLRKAIFRWNMAWGRSHGVRLFIERHYGSQIRIQVEFNRGDSDASTVFAS